jgi:hypothetical protein
MLAVAMVTAARVNMTGRRSNRHSKGWQRDSETGWKSEDEERRL